MTPAGCDALQRWTFAARDSDAIAADTAKILRSAMGGLAEADADELSVGFVGALRNMTDDAIAALLVAVSAENDTR